MNCVDNVAAKKIGKSIRHDAGKTGHQKKDIATTSKHGGVNLAETQSTDVCNVESPSGQGDLEKNRDDDSESVDTLVGDEHRDEAITYSPSSGNIDQQLVDSSIPDVVPRDIEFLKESWANMAQNDEGIKLKDSKLVDNQQFQLVVHKKKKNRQKSQAKSNKGSYSTRLRVGAPKSVQFKL